MSDIKGVYLCSRKHKIPGYDIDYNDIKPGYDIDLLTSCENINLGAYDFIIATPPCNWWSHANYRRYTSDVARSTMHLLPYCLEKCKGSGKYFIVENVQNLTRFKESGLMEPDCYIYIFGGHTFWTNIELDLSDLVPIKQNKNYISRSKRDNNYNVHIVINRFLESVTRLYV